MRRALLACLIVLCVVPAAGAQTGWPPPQVVVCGDGQFDYAHAGEPKVIPLWCYSGPERQPLTIEVTEPPVLGTLAPAPDHPNGLPAVTYTPPAEGGKDTFTYVATDAGGRSSRATVTVNVARPGTTINPVCDPVRLPSQVVSSIRLRCHDYEGDTLRYRLATGPGYGTATITGDQFRYEPDVPYQEVNDGVRVQVRDEHGGAATLQLDFRPDAWWPECATTQLVETRADRPVAVTLRCPAGVEIFEPPARGTFTTRHDGDFSLLTYVPDATAMGRYAAQVVFRSGSGQGALMAQRFIVNPVPPRRPRVTLTVPPQPQRRVLREGLRAEVRCDCRFAASIRVGTRDVATVAARSGSIVLPLDRAAKRHLRRARRPAVRVAIVPEGFRRPTAQWVELLRPQP